MALALTGLAPSTHGDFDHYTFALTWQPGICAAQHCVAGQPRTPLIGLHGLWASLPDDLRSQGVVDRQWWARGCDLYGVSKGTPELTSDLHAQVEAAMPQFTQDLLTHEYDKHARCFGFDPKQFFATQLRMRDAVVSSAFGDYLTQQSGREVAHAAVVDRFNDTFRAKGRTSLQLQCERAPSAQWVLTQLWITIRSNELDAFPRSESLIDAEINQDTCPKDFLVPAWRSPVPEVRSS